MLKIIISFLFLFSVNTWAESGHDDHRKEEKYEEKHEEKHEENHDDNDHEEHAEHKEEVLDGFRLNVASTKTFEITFLKYSSQKITVPESAIYKGLNEVNVYRFREGLYKRIDFKTISKTKSDYIISSVDLSAGDQVVVSGVGFLRIAEIAASGGLSDSHSH